MPLDPGATLGPYQVVDQIGAGGMGEVYRARDARLGRDVAVKVLPADLAGDPDRRARLEFEARAVAGLSHPNIVAIHDIGEHDGVLFVVCELLEGRSLRAVLKGGRLTPPRLLEHARQIARGLAAAHERGLVHRDIKPDNLFVTRGGVVKILDFGLARSSGTPVVGHDATTVAGRTSPGILLGTAGYMAPEQVRGEAVDQRADVFAFGAVLYEMATGERAFDGASAIETLHAILQAEAPRERLRDVSPALTAVIERCLAKDAAARFASAGEVAFALEQIGDAGRVGHRRAFPAIAAAAAATLVVAGGWYGMSRRTPIAGGERHVRSIAVLPLANLSGDASQEFFADGVTEGLIGNLARIHGLRVISRTSAMQYKGNTGKSAKQIAGELGVDALVEGSVVRSGSRVSVDAQLIDIARDATIWTERYDRNEQDVITLEHDVSRAIAEQIKATLTPDDMARMKAAAPVNTAAHEAYLRGRYALNKFTEPELRAALEAFNTALEADPTYAPAYAGIADAYSALRGIWVDPQIIMPRARAAAQKALELDETLAEAHVSYGAIKLFYEFDWDGARTELTRAVALNPNLAEAHHQNAMRLAAVSRPQEAIAEIRLAQNLDPLSAPIMADVSWVYYCARDYRNELDTAKHAEALDPQFWFGLAMLGLAYEKAGQLPQAIATLERARRLEQSPLVLEMLGGAYATAGDTAGARAVLADLQKLQAQRYVCPYEVATVYAGLGDRMHAIEWLKRAYATRADCTPWLNVDAKFDTLRTDPGFKELAQTMGFTR